eukprot:4026285-Pleurochrysis_carterae.AAC.2
MLNIALHGLGLRRGTEERERSYGAVACSSQIQPYSLTPRKATRAARSLMASLPRRGRGDLLHARAPRAGEALLACTRSHDPTRHRAISQSRSRL